MSARAAERACVSGGQGARSRGRGHTGLEGRVLSFELVCLALYFSHALQEGCVCARGASAQSKTGEGRGPEWGGSEEERGRRRTFEAVLTADDFSANDRSTRQPTLDCRRELGARGTHWTRASFSATSAALKLSSGWASAGGGGPQALSASTELACGLLMLSRERVPGTCDRELPLRAESWVPSAHPHLALLTSLLLIRSKHSTTVQLTGTHLGLVALDQSLSLLELHRPLLSTFFRRPSVPPPKQAMGAQQFDSATYLRGLGWNGPGSSLNNSAGGRAKPVTVAQKKTLSGVGRDRDTSFAWWDAVFTSVAKKVGTGQVRRGVVPRSQPCTPD